MITWGVVGKSDINSFSRWVANRIWPGKGRDFGNCQAMAVLEDDVLIAGIVWHNYEPDSGVIEVSAGATSKRWLTRKTLAAMFGIPFKEWGIQCLVMRVDPDDEPLHRMLKSYGFEVYVIPRLRGRDRDEHVFTLTDDAWRASKFNKKEIAHG
ncbi:GNAT family protein [Agrobacterium cavarae]|uniref:GNAT family protein n=1 Tax=Agrobacterium cavarae TaxID=2528239 RepID=UPI0028A2B858|nr:GNAT family protein [Agrobacterium cavarae]